MVSKIKLMDNEDLFGFDCQLFWQLLEVVHNAIHVSFLLLRSIDILNLQSQTQ